MKRFVSALAFPTLLYLPCVYLFAGKFLFAPTMSALYDDFAVWVTPKWTIKRGVAAAFIGIAITSFFVSTHSEAQRTSTPGSHVEARDKSLYLDGTRFEVKGIHYGPWRSGTVNECSGGRNGYLCEGTSPGVRDALQDLHGFTTERATRSIKRLSEYRGVPGEDQVAR